MAATPDRLEAVQKVSETMNKESPNEQLEHMTKKEHFQTVMSIEKSALSSPSFERVDNKAFNSDEAHKIESTPAFGDENVTAQKNGSATDQEGKKKGNQGQSEEVEGVGGVRSKSSTAQTSGSHSLMDEVSKINKNVSSMSKMRPEQVKAQAKEIISQIESAKAQLSQPNTSIKPSYQTVLNNRLTHIDDNLKIALNKAGVEYQPPAAVQGTESPNVVNKFLGFLTNSQSQLNNLDVAIDKFQTEGINPANMLAIQVKVGYVQQQIELFTSLLNKALESTKTIMNVQV